MRRRPAVVAAALAVLTTAPAVTAEAGEINSDTITVGKGVNGATLGMTRAQVIEDGTKLYYVTSRLAGRKVETQFVVDRFSPATARVVNVFMLSR